MNREYLYTLRWYVNNKASWEADSKKKVLDLLSKLLEEKLDEPELPGIDDPNALHIGLIVGHEKRAPGASFNNEAFKHEYDYNTAVAAAVATIAEQMGVKTSVVFRDGIGISGAYREMRKIAPDCCIELHFNAYNGKVTGTETLCTTDANDKELANMVQSFVCAAFGREGFSRGVKVLSRSSRGGGNVYSGYGFANCLVEPFFGDNAGEAKMAAGNIDKYAKSLVEACLNWAAS